MALTPRLTSDTPDVTRTADLIKKTVDPLLKQKYLTGRLLTGIDVTAATPFVVTHGLGRAATGAVVVSAVGDAMIMVRAYPAYEPAPNANKQLALIPSATGTVALWVF